MSNGVPTPKSFPQLMGDTIATYLSKIPVDDLNEASAVLSFFEAFNQAIYRSSGDILSILRESSLDRASRETLLKVAKDERVNIIKDKVATGTVVITDSNFEKISTKIYAGTAAPSLGSLTLNVFDASNFPASGSIYIGRGTNNIEGPLSYSSITPVGSYYVLNLTTPTTKYHNSSELVILAQGGNRTIPAGQVVRTKAIGSASSINFTVLKAVTILDGENSVSGVSIVAQEPGTKGNVPSGAIKEFSSEPFDGAVITNLVPLTTGRNRQTNEELVDAIKNARESRGFGTARAIQTSVLNAQASDEGSRIISSKIVDDGEYTQLYIDNGTGLEEQTEGVGYEILIDSAIGGERQVKLQTGGQQTSIAKAFLKSTLMAPYLIYGGNALAVKVGGQISEHVFSADDFTTEGYVTAYEVVTSINANSDLKFNARTADNGTNIILFSKSELNEFLQLTTTTLGDDVATVFGFTTQEIQTLRLYKNNQPLTRNGITPLISSAPQSNWVNSITTGETLTLNVDNTGDVTYTFVDADFIAEGSYISVSKDNSLASWANVINRKIPGITATPNGTHITITSNLGNNSRASIEIVSILSTLVSKGMFTSNYGLSIKGASPDYILNRNTAELKLYSPLLSGDKLTIGTEKTRASISSDIIPNGTLLLSDDAYLWLLVDEPSAEIVNHGVLSNSLAAISKMGSNILNFTSHVPNAFINAEIGDYVIFWSEEVDINNRFEGRILSITGGSSNAINIQLTSTEYSNCIDEPFITYETGLVILRTPTPPQKLKIPAGSYNINDIVDIINATGYGINATTENEEVLVLSTNSYNPLLGSILFVTADISGQNLLFTNGDYAETIVAHNAYQDNNGLENDFPLFINNSIISEDEADTPNAYISNIVSDIDISSLITPNDIISILNPYTGIPDAQCSGQKTQLSNIVGSNLGITPNDTIRRIRIGERYTMLLPLDFGSGDSMVVVLDGDNSNNTFTIPLYRKALVNNIAPNSSLNFRAYDVDSGLTETFDTFFGSDFSFDNYKVLMKAKNVIDPNSLTNEDAIVFYCALFGEIGNQYRIGYEYPTAANTEISHAITVNAYTDIKISLKSGGSVINDIDGTTEWDVLVSPDTPVPGIETVTYSYTGTGTAPNLGTLVPGNYVTIVGGGGFDSANLGTFRISAATSTSFSVLRPNGSAVAENNIPTLLSNVIFLYENSDTTAKEIVDYVNELLSNYITAQLIDDNGITGAGVISLSTYEDSGFVEDLVQLVDGINWIATSDVSSIAPLPNFIFKKPLELYNYDTNTLNAYVFNSGIEEIRLIPTTYKQLNALVHIYAISGITTVGNVINSLRGNSLTIASDILGAEGSVLVTGGIGNSFTTPITGTASLLNELQFYTSSIGGIMYGTKVLVARSAISGLHKKQWLKVESKTQQQKVLNLSTATIGSLLPNTYNTTLVRLIDANNDGRYFGLPRNNINDLDRTFTIEKHGRFTCLSWNYGYGTDPTFSKSVDINDSAGGEIEVTHNTTTGTTKYEVTVGDIKFANAQIGDLVEISNFTDYENNGIFIVVGVGAYDNYIVVNNPNGITAGSAVVNPGDISILTQVREGDSVTIAEPFAAVNQGTYRVIRKYRSSIWFDNQNSVTETVNIPINSVDIGFDASTEFNIYHPYSNGITWLCWNYLGTEPTMINALMGYKLQLGTAFHADNRGIFPITNSSPGLAEVFVINCVSAASITTGQYFTFDKPNGGTSYYVWYNKDGGGGDPSVFGKTGIEVVVTTGDTDEVVALATSNAMFAVGDITNIISGNQVQVTSNVTGFTVPASNVDVGGTFSINITQSGIPMHVEFINVISTPESGITITGVGGDTLQVHKPALIFNDYENTSINDLLIIDGDILDSTNAGIYTVLNVLNKNEAILIGANKSEQVDIPLLTKYNDIKVLESTPYLGYKRIHNLAVDPSGSSRGVVIFDSDDQYNKITTNSNTTISAIGKLNFNTNLINGLDAYRYHTGLMREVNKIVYGDPRDEMTYPGVIASGATIYTALPLVKRLKLGISVRLQTGISFARIVEQVRNNVSALVNSTPMGESIAISSIVKVVDIIPGVKAVAISSPNYNVSNDLITSVFGEKLFIIDSVNDIFVSKID